MLHRIAQCAVLKISNHRIGLREFGLVISLHVVNTQRSLEDVLRLLVSRCTCACATISSRRLMNGRNRNILRLSHHNQSHIVPQWLSKQNQAVTELSLCLAIE